MAEAEGSQRPVRCQGHPVAGWLLRAWGWQAAFDGLPARQGVIVVYPHTSNWDFVVGMLAKWAFGVTVHLWGKDSLFRIPVFSWFLRRQGGVPVDRSRPQGVVADMVQRMKQARERDQWLWLALAPEGTRSYREAWRSGFYTVALEAGVPLGLAVLDFGRKRIALEHFLMLTGDAERDMARIAEVYAGVRGKRPELAAPIRLP